MVNLIEKLNNSSKEKHKNKVLSIRIKWISY